MKRKIALAIGTSLLCIAILTGCNSSVAAEDAFSAANSGDTENAQKLYTNIIDNSSEQKEQLNKLLSAEFEQLLDNYNHEELTDDQAKEEFKKYSEAFEGIESVETARENLKELIDSKKSFKSAKESEAEENYGRAYAEYRHVSALDINYDEAQKQMDVCLSAFESEILRLCEEQAYYKAISNTIDLMEELGISMPMSDDDTLGIDDCFLFFLNKWQNRVVLKMLKHQCKKTLQTDASMTISMI
jgi:host cell surface-exposed lipoprotein